MSGGIAYSEMVELLKKGPPSLGNTVAPIESCEKNEVLSPQSMRQILTDQGFIYPRKNIIFHCLKGGAAKTTLAYNTAYRLSQLGTRVLLVDLDKQANATYSFDVEHPKFVFLDVVLERCSTQEALIPVGEFLDLLPSSLDNARLEMELVNIRKNPRMFYRNLFASIRDKYDVVLFDLPPDLSQNTYLSTLFADTVCIPTTADEYSVYGMKLTLSSVEGIQSEYGDLKQEIFIIWTKFDSREKSALGYIRSFKEEGKARVLPVVIRTDVTFKHAQSRGKSIFQYTRKAYAREDMDILAQELVGLRSFLKKRNMA